MHIKLKSFFICLLSLLILSSTFGIYTNVSAVESNAVLGKINIGNNASVSLTNIQMIPVNDQQALAVTISIENNGSKEIAFVDYWIKLKLKSGSVISPTLNAADKAKDKILPGTVQTYTFFTTVNNGIKYDDVAVQIIKWDFNVADFQRVIGTIQVPASYNGINQSGQTFTFNNSQIKVEFGEVFNFELDKKNKIKVKINLTNTGSRSVVLPTLKYFLVTADKTMYQMTSSKNDNLTLQPKIALETDLSVEIPSSLNSNKMQIILVYSEENAKMDIPLKAYDLNLANANREQQSDNISTGIEKVVIIGNYKYGVSLQSVQRLPWEDDDILTAKIQFTNKNAEAAPIPDISGVFYLDKVKLKEDTVKKIQVNNLVALPVNGKAEMMIYTKIPFNNTMNKLGLDLYNIVDTGSSSSEKVKLLGFEVNQSAFQAIAKVNINNSKKMTTQGKSSTLKIKSVDSYTGNSTRIYNILVEVQNDEKRMTNLNKMTGYLKTVNQSYFPVKISEIKDKISPSGKALYSVSAKLPTNFNTNGMTLVLGELIDNDTAYNNVTEFSLPSESNLAVSGEYKDIELYPYKINIDTIRINLTSDATVKFQYTLTKEQSYEVTPEGHSMVMELVDDKLNTSYSKAFKLGEDLQLGTKETTMVASMNITNPNEKIQQIDGFTINIYDEFEGHKKLLASKKIYAIFID